MKYYIQTITPLHIGNGEELSPLDYVLMNGKYFRITQQNIQEFLISIDLKYIDEYSNWIMNITNEITQLEDQKKRERNKFGKDKNQKLSQLRKDFNLKTFVRKIGKENEFETFLKTKTYISYLSKPKMQIRGLLKTANNNPYIPGTSIKGAIRTALFYDYLINYKDFENIKKILKSSYLYAKKKIEVNFREIDKQKKYFAEKLEQEAFYCGLQKNDERINYSDEKLDVFKFLQISDGKVISDNSLTLENIDLYLVSKDKNGVKNAQQQSQAPTVEAIAENKLIEFEIDFNIDYLLTIKQNLKDKEHIEIKNGRNIEKQWIEIRSKIKNIFGIDIIQLTFNNKDEFQTKIINSIVNKIYLFSQKQKDWDSNWLENIMNYNNQKQFQNAYIQSGFNKLIDDNLIHFGFGSGFTGITELLFILDEKYPELKQQFKEIMELFRIGNSPKNRGNFTANPNNFPKSKRLAARNEEIIPLGWAKLFSKEAYQAQAKKQKQFNNLTIEADELYKNKDYEKAIEKYKEAQELDKNADLSSKIENCLAEIEKIEEQKRKEENLKKYEIEKQKRDDEEKKRQKNNQKIAEEIKKYGYKNFLKDKNTFASGRNIIEKFKKKVAISENDCPFIKEFIERCIKNEGKKGWKNFKRDNNWNKVTSWVGKETAQQWFNDLIN